MYNKYQSQRSGGSDSGKPSNRGTWNRAGGGRPAPREMHDAVCSECRKPCQVPFFPSEGRAVKCRDCFRTDGPTFGNDRPSFGDRDDRRPAFDRKPSYSDRSERPSFAPREDRPSAGNSDVRLAAIERKIDQILELLDADEV